MSAFRRGGVVLIALGLMVLSACSGRPPRPPGPEIDPAAAGEAAIAKYDANGDQALNQEELQKCPALAAAVKRVDADGDGKVTTAEITQRFKALLEGPVLFPCSPKVTLDGQPLAGATVTFEPEPFMGDAIKPCSGVTDEFGNVTLRGHSEKYDGIFPGFYRVKISKLVDGAESIPAKYNTETTLGHEAAQDIPGVGLVQFDLATSAQ